AEANRLYYRIGVNTDFDARIFRLMERARKKLGRTGRSLWSIHDPIEVLGEMRLFKEPSEVERLAKACSISAHGHCQAMKSAKAGMNEYEIEALLFHEFRRQGALRLGYGSIVASGENACVL